LSYLAERILKIKYFINDINDVKRIYFTGVFKNVIVLGQVGASSSITSALDISL
jgi:hypothetical protein